MGPWRQTEYISASRNGTKLYRRLKYCGEWLYEHRIVFAKIHGYLCATKTVNHKDLNGLNNDPDNLELITPRQNIRHAYGLYRRSGMSAAEARAKWIQAARGKQHGAHKY